MIIKASELSVETHYRHLQVSTKETAFLYKVLLKIMLNLSTLISQKDNDGFILALGYIKLFKPELLLLFE